MEPLVSITIVTYNSGRFIAACLESLRRQDYPSLEVIVVDNHSQDNTAEILRAQTGTLPIVCLWNETNNGFCGGQNQAIAASHGQWILTLNPDVILEPDFISRLVAGVSAVESRDPALGMACGRLQAMEPGQALLDSTGMYFTPELRHMDRDGRQPDCGQHRQTEYVFGATGAAGFYRREMIEVISLPGDDGPEFFDRDFFAYREDADLSWRAQLMGWNCLYVPEARGAHARTCRPENRRQMHPLVNMHSVKNRFLMRIKNIGAGLYLRNLLAITWRDLCVIGYCLLVERSSLPGLTAIWSGWSRTWAKRRWIQSRRTRSDNELAPWFQFQPTSQPVAPALVPEKALAATAGLTAAIGSGSGSGGRS